MQSILFLVAVYAGLYWPDLDLDLLWLLHHRSIVTHSIFLPLAGLVLFRNTVSKRWLFSSIAGMCLGISVHLSADVLSPMRGYALIYLPVITVSIGNALSWGWLLANSVGGLMVTFGLTRQQKLTSVCFFGTVLLYGIFNEGHITLAVPALISWALAYIITSRLWFRVIRL